MASLFEELFDNPDFSDALVVLTTETVEECRARMGRVNNNSTATAPPQKRARRTARAAAASGAESATTDATSEPSPSSSATADSRDGQAHDWQEIHAHKNILCVNSAFFKGACSFNAASGCHSEQSKKRKLQPDQNSEGTSASDQDVVIIDSLAAAELPTARAMIRFMYAQQLPADLTCSSAMALYRLADKYRVDRLRLHCLKHLAAVPMSRYAREEVCQLLHMMDLIWVEAAVEGPLGAAAAAVIVAAKRHVRQLEQFWQHVENREAFMQLPYSFVLDVLDSDSLSVRSENTALVAAVSWLRGPRGRELEKCQAGKEQGSATETGGGGEQKGGSEAAKDAEQGPHGSEPAAEEEEGQAKDGQDEQQDEGHAMRKAVLEAVRLLQLDPYFLSDVLPELPECRKLLGAEAYSVLLRYHMYSQPARSKIRDQFPVFQQWAKPRRAPRPGPAKLQVSWSRDELQAAVCDVRAGHMEDVTVDGEQAFSAGLDYTCQFYMNQDDDPSPQRLRLWAGVVGSLWLAGAKSAEDDFAKWPCNIAMEWGTGANKETSEVFAAAALESGTGTTVYLAPDENAEEALAYGIVGDMLKFTVLVGQLL